VAATAFFYETSGIAEPAEAAELPRLPPAHDDPPPPPAADSDMPAHERQLATQGAAMQDPDAAAASKVPVAVAEPAASAPVATSEPAEASPPSAPLEPAPQPVHTGAVLPAPAPEQATVVIQGTAGDDLLVGTAKNEHILGGAGADTLQGGGGHDTLDGGDGDDRIEVTANVVAEGGKGADTFVIQAPAQFGHAGALLGVILDYSGGEGDRVMTWRGDSIKFPPHPLTDDKTAAQLGQGFGPTTSQDQTFDPTTLTRVEVDLNGDGVADGYILVGEHGHALGGDDHPIVVTGRSLNDGDPFGG